MRREWTRLDAENQLKKEVLEELQLLGGERITYIPEELWQHADVQDEVQSALNNPKEDDAEPVAEIMRRIFYEAYMDHTVVQEDEEQLDKHQTYKRNPGRSVPITPYTATENEVLGGAAARGYLEQELSNVFDVVRFRHDLGGMMLQEQIWRFMTSPVNQLLTFQQQRRYRVAPLKASGRVVAEQITGAERNRLRHQTTLIIADTGEDITVSNDAQRLIALQSNLLLGDGLFAGDTYVFMPAELSKVPDTFFSPYPVSAGQNCTIIGYLGDKRHGGTVVGEALRISREISTRYDVEAKDALIFLLYGHFPEQNPITSRLSVLPIFDPEVDNTNALNWDENKSPDWGENREASFGPITLRISPQVSAQRLSDYFRTLQKVVFEQDNSLEKVRNLDLFCFVNIATSNNRLHSGKRRGILSWKELFGIWRQSLQVTDKERRSEGHPSRFREAYYSVKRVLFPFIRREQD